LIPKDREILEGSKDPTTDLEFRYRTWQRATCVERAAGGDKKPAAGGSVKPNGPGADFGIASKTRGQER
jgi:hypothetical protein